MKTLLQCLGFTASYSSIKIKEFSPIYLYCKMINRVKMSGRYEAYLSYFYTALRNASLISLKKSKKKANLLVFLKLKNTLNTLG